MQSPTAGRAGQWVDELACGALTLLLLNDRRPSSRRNCAETQDRPRRPALPTFLYSEHVAAFLRFEGPLPNMLYVLGGRNRQQGPVSAVEMLDTWNGLWVPCSPMPRRRAGGAAAQLPDGRLLVVGGYDERGIAKGLLAQCDVYDPVTESWSEAAPLRRARWGHGCAALGGKIYAVGGCSLPDHAPRQEAFMETLRSCEVYDPKIGTWETAAPLQIARSGSRVVALGDRRLAAVGGCDDVFGRAETQATVEIYSAATGCWELLGTRLTRPRTSAAVAALDDQRFFVAGGAPSQFSVEVFCAPPLVDQESDKEPQQASTQTDHAQPDVADMLEGRMGCQATVVRLPGTSGSYPLCDTECVLVVGGERCEEVSPDGAVTPAPRVRQLSTVAAYDLVGKEWRKASAVPPMALPRTTVALCVGVGRVAGCRLVQ